MNLYIALSTKDILTILIFPVHEQDISFHWFLSSVSFFNVLYFLEYRPITSLVLPDWVHIYLCYFSFIIMRRPSLSCYVFCLEIYFVTYKYGYTRFSLHAICLEYFFPPFRFESMLVLAAEICFLRVTYGCVLFFDPVHYSVPCYWWIQFIYI